LTLRPGAEANGDLPNPPELDGELERIMDVVRRTWPALQWSVRPAAEVLMKIDWLERERARRRAAGWHETAAGEYTRADLPGWAFKVEEVSMNVYRATATDGKGHKVERMAAENEYDALFDAILQAAHAMQALLNGRGA
jgi:hypothetical protein